MDYFVRDAAGQLLAEQLPVAELAARFGTPCYIYSRAALEERFLAFDSALTGQPHLVCFAVKANSNLAVLNVLARQGAGFDIVSGGELARVIKAGGNPAKVVFSGVAKSVAEIEQALAAGILCFNVESQPELERIAAVAARLGVQAPISLRVNPDVDAATHPYISTGLKENKFGVPLDAALELYRWAVAQPALKVVGVDCHIGSQITTLSPFIDATKRVLALVDQLAAEGIELHHIDLGGGVGVRYRNEQPIAPADYVAALRELMAGRPQTLLMEPGRAIAANAGIFVTQVEFIKANGDKRFAIVDGAMNDLIRPSLYGAWMAIEAVQPTTAPLASYDIVGPVCETGDFLGKERELAISPGDLLAVRGAGAYGFTMSSNYNSRPRVAELMVDGDKVHLVRARESVESLWAGEQLLEATR